MRAGHAGIQKHPETGALDGMMEDEDVAEAQDNHQAPSARQAAAGDTSADRRQHSHTDKAPQFPAPATGAGTPLPYTEEVPRVVQRAPRQFNAKPSGKRYVSGHVRV